MSVQTIKIRAGFYELSGVMHSRPSYNGGPVCGGQIYAERFPPEKDEGETLPASWECFCRECLACDPNGWPTLAECVQVAPEFWCAAT